MEENANQQSVGQANPQRLESLLPQVQSLAKIEMKHMLEKPSPHITLFDMYQLAQQVIDQLHQPDVLGVVITHGTDTLEETAYFLHLTVDSPKPVVVTGAMRSHNEFGADGLRNIVQSIRVASHPQAQGRGTLVVFQDEIHSAAQVTKIHTTLPSTFQSPGQGPLGILTKQEVIFYHVPKPERLMIPLTPPTAEVLLLKATASMDDRWIRLAMDQGIDGIVIEALGQGNLPPTLLPGCLEAIEKQIPIYLVSRCPEGPVAATYDYEGGGHHLAKSGFIFCQGINGQKARIQLILALSAGIDVSSSKWNHNEQEVT